MVLLSTDIKVSDHKSLRFFFIINKINYKNYFSLKKTHKEFELDYTNYSCN